MTKPRFTTVSTILLGLFLTLFINYHSFLVDFNLVPGDKGDTRLIIFILEHWLNVFKGQESFFVLSIFYPDRLALAYADGMFLFSFPYALFRMLGFDYFSSYQLLFVSMTTFGYATCVLLLRKVMDLDLGFAVLGSVVLTSLNSMQFQTDVGQLLGVYFYPSLVGLLCIYLTASNKASPKAWCSLVVFALLLGLLFFTSYYPAWFFLFTLLLYVAVYFTLSLVNHSISITLRAAAAFIRHNRLQLSISLAVFIISLTPFMCTYAPLALSNAHRSFDLVLDFSPSIRDIINVSDRNYLWSPILKWAHFRFGNREVQMGSPWIVLVLFILSYIRQCSILLRGKQAGASSRDRFVFLLSTTALAICALVVKSHDISLWYAVYKLVPGASALRALGRYLIIVDMIIVVAEAHALSELYKFIKSRPPSGRKYLLNISFGILGLALVAEQANATPFRLDKSRELSFLSRFQAPGVGCKAFFINGAPSTDLPVGYYQLDAMMIAMNRGIPTVNGYSGFSPNEVFTMVPTGIEYRYKILKWLVLNDVREGICELDNQSTAFRTVDVVAEYEKDDQLYRASNLATYDQLFFAAESFVSGRNDLANLHPRYLEEHGYLDPSLGYETGVPYKWIADKYWMGERACGKRQCVGIGIVGSYAEIKEIAAKYAPQATEVYFPFPSRLAPGDDTPGNLRGELLIVFPLSVFSQ